MTSDQLRESIAEIKKYMQDALDTHERDLLGDLISAIGHTQGQPVASSETLSEELDQRAIDFDTRHPKLSKLLREVMDTLGKMGV